ncbi:hypothetical protein EET67_23345 [Pseudaminobacter arsenicus]|uniref:Two-component sensor histidine kinase n=1 Tax=Borborobacter arsenicus TaxID=1851146 RepID=A0A432V043_9HYPH|nr:hypothetical protein [Pseudaminobacter arsenicus]RUM95422.1 hypothetical protein EET67_23345 [Pseudaminobacter arsenicus]
MAAKLGAGDLYYRVACQKKQAATDEFGNPVPGGGAWATQFSVRAAYTHRRGGEGVLAARLENRQLRLILAGIVLLAFLVIGLVTLWYRGETIGARADAVQARVELTEAVAALVPADLKRVLDP